MYWKIIPNLLTTLRVFLIIPTINALIAEQYLLAFGLFMVAGLSDCLDGFLARRFHWTSHFGAITDPLADKLLLMSSFTALGLLGHIPYWLLFVVIGRDIWILCGATAYHFFVGEPEFTPSQISKFNTFFQILFIGLLLFNLSFSKVPVQVLETLGFLIFTLSILSFIDYTWIWGYRAWQIKCKRI
jgi:cardiolipin synthase